FSGRCAERASGREGHSVPSANVNPHARRGSWQLPLQPGVQRQVVEQAEERRLTNREVGLARDELLARLHVAGGDEFGGAGGGEIGNVHGALFEMELQSNHAVAEDERLLGAARTVGYAASPGRE